jgi:hypothetical protein
MVKVIRVADDGTETACIEVDDFTLEVIYSGLAEMLRNAASAPAPDAAPSCELSREARQRRQRVLSRLRD